MPDINLDKIDWDKGDGLVPAIVQNSDNGQILMLAYMDRAALAQTISSKKVTFFSRSKTGFGPRAKHQAIGLITLAAKWIVTLTRF